MSGSGDHDDPFVEMRLPVTPVSAPDAAAVQRERVVSRLRSLQASGGSHRKSHRRFRKFAVLAAALVAASSAAAAAWLESAGFFQASEPASAAPRTGDVRAAPVGAMAAVASSAPAASLPEPAVVPPAPQAKRSANAAGDVHSAPKPTRPRSTPAKLAEESTLAQENVLLRRALASSHGGDDELAVSLHESLITRYPRSPLAQNAELERLRALARLGDVGATRSAARRYLTRYPDGMGADEARRLLLEPSRTATAHGNLR
jgi:hypothetical protein